jgi:RNA polymerase-binding transcription factor DksA
MDIERYREQLESEQQNVTEELQAIATYNKMTGDWEATPAGPADDADPNEAADDAEESTEREALVSNLEIRYRNIKRALRKIEAGTYGICEISGEEIEPARLEANPAARTSIANRERENELPL